MYWRFTVEFPPREDLLKVQELIIYSLLQTFLYPLFIGRSCGNTAAPSLSSLLPTRSQASHNNFSSEPHTSHLLFRYTSKFSSRLGRVNENNVARTRNCCGWPSSPHERLVSYSLFTNTYTCKLGIFPYLENS